jgi:hypothetical protein
VLWPVRIQAQPPWSGEQPDRGLYSPMDPRSNCASEVARGPIGDGEVLLLRGPPPLHQALLSAPADGLGLPGTDRPRDPGGGQGQQAH